MTALLYAAKGGARGIVQMLVDAKADVGISDPYNLTPLIYAASASYTEIVKILLSANADSNAIDNSGNTALIYSCWYGTLEIAEALLMAGANAEQTNMNKETPLFVAVLYNHLDMVKLLLSMSANVNAAENGYTPLMWAAYQGNDVISIELINAGADVNMMNKYGQTALSLCEAEGVANKENEYLRIKEALTAAGATE